MTGDLQQNCGRLLLDQVTSAKTMGGMLATLCRTLLLTKHASVFFFLHHFCFIWVNR